MGFCLLMPRDRVLALEDEHFLRSRNSLLFFSPFPVSEGYNSSVGKSLGCLLGFILT